MNIPKSCRRPVVSLLYATKSAFTAPNLCWACALASPVIFLTGDHVMQIGFGQISPSASSTRDLGTRLQMIRQMVIATPLLGINDLGRPVTPTFFSETDFIYNYLHIVQQ